MRILYTFLCLCILSAQAQVEFFDDFESYNNGDLIGESSDVWETWIAPGGGVEDTPVTDTNPSSGDLSLELFSDQDIGGPTDIMLPFGQKFTDGLFRVYMKMYIQEGAAGYFNIQGEVTPGVIWSAEFHFLDDGTVLMQNTDDGILATTIIETGRWMDLELEANLTLNTWILKLDGETISIFENSVNYLAGINLYPVNGGEGLLSHYFVDDIGFSHEPYELPALDAAVIQLNMETVGLTGFETDVIANVKNTGSEIINELSVSLVTPDQTITKDFTDMGLASLDVFQVDFDEPVTIAEGEAQYSIEVFNANGMMEDAVASNNSTSTFALGYTPALNKVVLGEEKTGTWCTWCPRGAVFMDIMKEKYPDYFAGIAVHNADPMAVNDYDMGLGTIFPSGYPNLVLERTFNFDPSGVEFNFLQSVVNEPNCFLDVQAKIDEENNLLVKGIGLAVKEMAGSQAYRLNVALTEDHVTGTESGYDQINAYAGGGNGVMGGFELLPSPVPAAQMNYDDVARAILGGISGPANSVPSDVQVGDDFQYTFSTAIDEAWDLSEMSVVVMLLRPDGTSDNALKVHLDVALDNWEDEVIDTTGTAIHDMKQLEDVIVYPNPSVGTMNVEIPVTQSGNLSIQVFDIVGKLVSNQEYGVVTEDVIIPMHLSNLANGSYKMLIQIGDYSTVQSIHLNR